MSEETATRHKGIVKWFSADKCFGFIGLDDEPDVFVHFTGIRGTGWRNLREGQLVDFEIVQGKKGKQANDCFVAEDSAPPQTGTD